MDTIKSIRQKLLDVYSENKNNSIVEIINANFIVSDDILIRKPNEEYINRELSWYLSQSLNVNDIPAPIPAIWKIVADKSGNINSNYGWCIFSKENYNQYDNVIKELIRDKESRRAVCIYTRPSMHIDWNRNGMTDFMCTNYTHHFIRNNKLVYIVYQRSCDAVFGYNNDVAWHKFVANKMFEELSKTYPLTDTEMYYNVGSLHVYPRHYKHLEELLTNEQ